MKNTYITMKIKKKTVHITYNVRHLRILFYNYTTTVRGKMVCWMKICWRRLLYHHFA